MIDRPAPPRDAAPAGLTVCGLGTRPESEATLEALSALREAATVYSELRAEWLGRWCRRPPEPAGDAAGIAEAARAAPVALAVWGHPRLSRFACEAEAACLAAGVPVRVLAAVSPLGAALSRGLRFLGGEKGAPSAAAWPAERLLERTPKARPSSLAVFDPRGGRWEEVRRSLAGLFDPSRLVVILPLDSDEVWSCELGAWRPEGLGPAIVLLSEDGAGSSPLSGGRRT